MPPPAQTIPIVLDRENNGKLPWSFRSSPLTLALSTVGYDLSGIASLVVEIHAQRTHAGQQPLARTIITNPAGYSANAAFTAAQMNIDLNGRDSRLVWILVRADLTAGTPDIYSLTQLSLVSHPASNEAPPSPGLDLYATEAGLAAAISSEAAARSAADTAEAAARVAADKFGTIIVTGDSHVAVANNTWPAMMRARYRLFAECPWINFAFSGRTAADVLDKFDSELVPAIPPGLPWTLIFSAGTNDLGGGAVYGPVKAIIEQIALRAKNLGAVVAWVTSPTPIGDIENLNMAMRAAIQGGTSSVDILIDLEDCGLELMDTIHLNADSNHRAADIANDILTGGYVRPGHKESPPASVSDINLAGYYRALAEADLVTYQQVLVDQGSSTTLTAATKAKMATVLAFLYGAAGRENVKAFFLGSDQNVGLGLAAYGIGGLTASELAFNTATSGSNWTTDGILMTGRLAQYGDPGLPVSPEYTHIVIADTDGALKQIYDGDVQTYGDYVPAMHIGGGNAEEFKIAYLDSSNVGHTATIPLQHGSTSTGELISMIAAGYKSWGVLSNDHSQFRQIDAAGGQRSPAHIWFNFNASGSGWRLKFFAHVARQLTNAQMFTLRTLLRATISPAGV